MNSVSLADSLVTDLTSSKFAGSLVIVDVIFVVLVAATVLF